MDALNKEHTIHTYKDRRGGTTISHSANGPFKLPSDKSEWVSWFTKYAPISKRVELHHDVILSVVTSESIRMCDSDNHYLNTSWARHGSTAFDQGYLKLLGFDLSFPPRKTPSVYTNDSLRFCGPSDAKYAYYQRESETSYEEYVSDSKVSLVYTPQGCVLQVDNYRLTPCAKEVDVRSTADSFFYNMYPDMWGYVLEYNLRVSVRA